MKKILLSIVACLSLTGELLAQKTSDFTYFQVVSVLNSGKVEVLLEIMIRLQKIIEDIVFIE